jgi:tetratricopeptide (TPR) repeat protein
MGTPNYMSPEQVRGERVDAGTDVFSLGAVFYELLSGRKPFDGEAMHGVLQNVLEGEPAPLADVAPDVPRMLASVVEAALVKDRTRRYADAGELRRALAEVRAALESGRDLDAEASADAPTTVGNAATTFVPRPVRVHGTAALDVASATSPPLRSTATLSGTARTQMRRGSSVADRTRVASRSRIDHDGAPEREMARTVLQDAAPHARTPTVLVASVAAVLAVAVGAGAWMASRRSAADAEQARSASGVTDALVSTQLELARRDLADKEYEAALRRAEHVLALRADEGQAREVARQARDTLARIEAAGQAARRARSEGRPDAAAEELWVMLTLDPRQPVAPELAAAVGARFRARAEEARLLGATARSAAEAVKAASMADFKRAAAAASDAEAAFRRGEYVRAAGRFLESRDAFERARRTARG